MSEASSGSRPPAPAKIPLSEQIVEIEREIRQRARVYPKWVSEGRYKRETADAKLAAIRAAHDTLIWLETNMDWIRAEAQRRLREARLAAEAESLREHPAVAAVLDEFPGATFTVNRAPGGRLP